MQWDVIEWNEREGRAVPVDLKDFGNVRTHLILRRQSEALIERHRHTLRELLGERLGQVDVAADSSGDCLSLRVRGLEIARVEGQVAPRIFFGLEGNWRRLESRSRNHGRP